jgi:hypothetical protein
MFLYPNKVVGFKVSGDFVHEGDPLNFNVFINNQYVGDVDLVEDELAGGSTVYVYTGVSTFIASLNTGLSIQGFGETNEIYQFPSDLLAEGSNTIRISQDDSIGNGYVEVALFGISGSTLVYESGIGSGSFDLSGSGGLYDFNFDLELPIPEGLSNLHEFDPVFDVDTGNLNQIFTGSGIHLRKDVTFSFDFLDQQGFAVATDDDYINNPLLDSVVFDVLNATGGTVFPNYFSGKSTRSLTISELDNESIFGSYTKDFGVRITLPNSFDNSIFTGVFLVYGNLPNITLLTPDYSEFSGAAQSTRGFDVGISLQNDLRYIRMDRYDVYASTGSDLQLPSLTYLDPKNQEGYLFSQSALNIEDIYNLRVDKYTLEQNIPYYFTVVPYGVLGSGKSIKFGPVTFVDTNENAEYIPLSASELNLVYGGGQSSDVFLTGSINGSGLIHIFDTGIYTTAQYLIEMKCFDGVRRSSKLIGVANTNIAPPNDLSLFEDVLNNTGVSAVSYSLTGVGDTSVGLYVNNVGGLGTYKFQATLI